MTCLVRLGLKLYENIIALLLSVIGCKLGNWCALRVGNASSLAMLVVWQVSLSSVFLSVFRCIVCNHELRLHANNRSLYAFIMMHALHRSKLTLEHCCVKCLSKSLHCVSQLYASTTERTSALCLVTICNEKLEGSFDWTQLLRKYRKWPVLWIIVRSSNTLGHIWVL